MEQASLSGNNEIGSNLSTSKEPDKVDQEEHELYIFPLFHKEVVHGSPSTHLRAQFTVNNDVKGIEVI